MERKPDKGFKYWFTNVFWFHYGKLGIIIVLALVVVVFLTVQAFKKERYDLNVVLALKGPVSYEATGELNGLIAEAAGDVDGNGEVNINIQTVDLSDEAHFEDNHYRLLLYLSLPEYTVFIMDGQYSQTYCSKEGYFNELADYGIETDDPTGKRITRAAGGYCGKWATTTTMSASPTGRRTGRATRNGRRPQSGRLRRSSPRKKALRAGLCAFAYLRGSRSLLTKGGGFGKNGRQRRRTCAAF
jgi:hypothetical protein